MLTNVFITLNKKFKVVVEIYLVIRVFNTTKHQKTMSSIKVIVCSIFSKTLEIIVQCDFRFNDNTP